MRFLRFIFSRLFFCILFIAAIFTAIIFLCLYLQTLLPVALGVLAAYALSILSALFLLLRDGDNDYKCAWLALIAALPVVGAILYAFSCTGGKKSHLNQPLPLPVSYLKSEYFKDGARYLKRLNQTIAAARSFVYLEYYIISKGKIWSALCEELEKAIARGVRVYIIYDGLGSTMHTPKKDFKRLLASGAQIKVFNKLKPFPVSKLNSRNHRKIAAIDGETVFLGGVNIADEYANISSPHGYWKDGGIMLTGDIAKEYANIFLRDFNCDIEQETEISEQSELPLSHAVVPVADAPDNKNTFCKELVTAKIYAAKKRVCILTPYLCVGEKLKDALVYAAERGVSVQIIIPEVPDKKLTFEISLTFAEQLINSGVEVYRYTPGFMHAKCVICDDEALLGSYNFDYRSMNLNYECGVWAGGELAKTAYEDFAESKIISAKMSSCKVDVLRKIARGALKLFAPLV